MAAGVTVIAFPAFDMSIILHPVYRIIASPSIWVACPAGVESIVVVSLLISLLLVPVDPRLNTHHSGLRGERVKDRGKLRLLSSRFLLQNSDSTISRLTVI